VVVLKVWFRVDDDDVHDDVKWEKRREEKGA
jgi:hypothetical protein